MPERSLKREIGPVGLIALAVSGIIGSGWLFAPMLSAQLAGPAAIVAWIVGSVSMLLLALTFAEISAMFPLPGGIASIPQVTHGNVVSIAMGWTAWLGYLFTAPVEVEATLRYLGGFAPDGARGILSAVSSGGVILSMIGFRHAIDMAGEVRNPGRNVPLSLIVAMFICLIIYLGLQIAFIGALQPTDLTDGWSGLHFTHPGGPLASIATALGLLWLVSLMNATAVISPFGSALVAVGANARLVMALTGSGFMPAVFARLSRFGVPFNALLLNLVVGWVAVLFLDFTELVAAHSSLVVLSFIVGPIAVVALRSLAADYRRPFRLPFVKVIGYSTFILATLIVYWSGWHTIRVLGIAMLAGAVLFAIRLRTMDRDDLDLRQAAWLLPYFLGIGLISWLGSFGGIGVIPEGYDIVVCAAFCAVMYSFALRSAISKNQFDEQADTVLARIGYDKAVLRDLEV